MSFGRKRKSSNSSSSVRLKPTSLFTPHGDVLASLKKVTLRDETPDVIREGIDIAGRKERDIISELPTSLDPAQMFNNQYVDALRTQLMGDFDVRDREQAEQLRNSLAARNSLDNSAGILAQSRRQESANRARGNIDAQALLGGADVFTQNLGNMLSVLQNLQRGRLANIEQSFAPAKLAAGFQGVMNPLITANANAQLAQTAAQARGGNSGLFSSIGSLLGGLA